MIIFDLQPRAALHVGEFIGIEREAVLDHIPSDSLFSACVMAWQRAGVDVGARIAQCQMDPGALWLTSAFPRAGAVRLYPFPMGVTPVDGRRQPVLEGKRLKRVRWVSESLFQKLVAGRSVEDESDPAKNFAQEGTVWLAQSELAQLGASLGDANGDVRLWKTQIVPRVTVDRAANVSNLFHSGRLVFAPGCGLWGMAQGAGAGWIVEGLNALQDEGVGGLRSVGHGAFTLATRVAPDVTMPDRGYGVLLSRYAPAGEAEIVAALQAPRSAYSLVTVGGWCQDDNGKPWRRKTVRLVAAGACIGLPAMGHLVAVTPEKVMSRPVYRFGRAFVLPVAEGALTGHEQ